MEAPTTLEVGGQGTGRHSETLTRHLRSAAQRSAQQSAAAAPTWWEQPAIGPEELGTKAEEGPFSEGPFPAPADARETSAAHPYRVSPGSNLLKVYPDIALAMLRSKTAAAGRVWLLLRHSDAAGRGRIPTTAAAGLLTGDGSPLRICGRRQLANLLRAGDGLYWQRDTGRDGAEWLRLGSTARVAAGLGVRRLGGSPVAVPPAALTGTIGQARAHLYAAFHSGRTRTDLLTGERRAAGPIARATLCKLSGAAANSQRNYERRTRVGRRSAIAVGPLVVAADEHEVAWRRGQALFRLRDGHGRHGRPGAVYLAWQLPNEYTGPHATLPRGRQKRLNRALADLFHDGMTGNDERTARGDSGQWAVATGQSPAGRTEEAADDRHWTAGEEQGTAAARRWPLSHSPRPPLPRRFYRTAKTAFLARHDGEKYWRYGGVWLWQPAIGDREDTIQMKQRRGANSRPQAGPLPAAGRQARPPQTEDQRPVS
ncbi:MAG: hypothetical protein KA170_02475 [Candidatus Promineofilum sp.]|nr:hypothetical protein [Promineifilum sp.]